MAKDATQGGVQALSAWTNQSGSTLYIQSVDPSGSLSGYYINRAAGYGCQNTPYPVTGWVYGTAITFTVLWENATESCNSITAWTGFYYQGQITTLWQLVINGSTSTGQIISGEDIFKPSQQKKSKTLKGK
uniref:wilavidin n=2 Tax=Gammaproteobacteria bacterium TaxID=1913989 RepID=UPI001D1A5B8D|nr:Chain A, wilavidin [Gammaproteobacteria bacterium]7OUQ_B Chain B, wilavidin [Gammaproteobacteria bacterium]7OUR_A Chain A, wilavidin [Gammaproteobacteria bacterium]7OUR_B Chain B, wilavidin [Gammaproteobacteria bacterium]7OUR_C Chain C, wilavidin [Gammaproteobacteria bacterium]7OUR_D Chain D, wilavidin [Gammaproteobacteria bacterium]7OUR_E Chain E, wilavidin [Gammaproteobacteria bacterium]7OUR_F Chain F, wilavidin [Gammaproteobacteria bacterium]